MNTTLSQSGAVAPRASAYAVAQQARANWERAKAMAAADRMHVEPARVIQPAAKVAQSPLQIREEVMAERGLDRRDIVQLAAQARLEAEFSIDAETAERKRTAHIKTKGAFIDLKA